MDSAEFIGKLKQRFNSVTFVQKETEYELDVLVLTAEKKPYDFYIWIDNDWAFMDIGATLKSEPNRYFWYQSWENLNGLDSDWINELFDDSNELLKLLLKHPTRIIQCKGIFSSSFECQFLDTDWKRISKNSVLHTNFNIPKINGRTKIYE
ncbi:hypothetical protein [Fulvivirga lutea]|uniref:Uncharacterized protein n=1 Tax=Fulvivirga lutea TaxID=2810512 RepID=A0A974WKQ4_9BACT|nr:hypothetical protein [Fulvivirga lutea]QSE98987.1 hypothetical protein JR347_07850 [Fulvivirga lutea]